MSEDRCIGAIEEIVKETKFVDGANSLFEKLKMNAPSCFPESREFLGTAVTAAAGAWLSMVIPLEAATEHNTSTDGKSSSKLTPDKTGAEAISNWEAALILRDPIYGPLITKDQAEQIPAAGKWGLQAIGGIDWAVNYRTPLVPMQMVTLDSKL